MLRSYAFGFGPIGAFGGSFAVMIVAFADAGKHPAFVFIDTAAWQRLHF
jgi:hypothetical protein